MQVAAPPLLSAGKVVFVTTKALLAAKAIHQVVAGLNL